ncbi:MAG TPA: mechanosensitive ion channel domain-containing protein [Microcoleaceae cyanobacterium]
MTRLIREQAVSCSIRRLSLDSLYYAGMNRQRYTRSSVFSLLLFVLTVSLIVLLSQASWAVSPFYRPMPSLALAIDPNVPVYQQGNIEYAYVSLDGEQLFPLTANTTPGKPTTALSPVQLRLQSIQPVLQRLLEQDFNPENFYVTVATLDRQTVILAGEHTKNTQEIILTVTDLDAQLAGKPLSILAKDWANITYQALLRGQASRRPEARQRQIIQVVVIGTAIVIVSLVLYGIHRWIYTLFDRRRERLLESAEKQLTSSLEANAIDLTQEFQQVQALRQRQMLNMMLRRLLRTAQLLIWSGGVAWILWTFPETRSWGKILITFVIRLFMVILVVFVVAQICRLLVNQRLQVLVEESSLNLDEMQRMVLRAPTLAGVLDEIIRFVAWCVAIILLIEWERLPVGAIWTGAGLMSVAFSLVFQNLLRDWLNGFFIVFGDYYAVGDMVNIANTAGLVEGMSLRSTRIRGEGGSLNTIPHGQIDTIQNLTKDWSRVDFSVAIAPKTDISQAMQVMKQVAEEMSVDPEWRSDILEPTSLIGVDQISASGTKISMWIKTKRSKQWAVEQAFRYRLKLAFDQAGIQMG